MINFFKKNKWQIIYAEKAGTPKKSLIVNAKTISQAKEQFFQSIKEKPLRIFSIMMIV